MNRKLIIEGNSVYEIDEECMLKKRLDKEREPNGKQKTEESHPRNSNKKGQE